MQKHSHPTPAGRAFWYTERLWQLADGLRVTTIAIADIPEFDENCWFREPPTCRQVAEHARQIFEADLAYPIILSADGKLMDGGPSHRQGLAPGPDRGESPALRPRPGAGLRPAR